MNFRFRLVMKHAINAVFPHRLSINLIEFIKQVSTSKIHQRTNILWWIDSSKSMWFLYEQMRIFCDFSILINKACIICLNNSVIIIFVNMHIVFLTIETFSLQFIFDYNLFGNHNWIISTNLYWKSKISRLKVNFREGTKLNWNQTRTFHKKTQISVVWNELRMLVSLIRANWLAVVIQELNQSLIYSKKWSKLLQLKNDSVRVTNRITSSIFYHRHRILFKYSRFDFFSLWLFFSWKVTGKLYYGNFVDFIGVWKRIMCLLSDFYIRRNFVDDSIDYILLYRITAIKSIHFIIVEI